MSLLEAGRAGGTTSNRARVQTNDLAAWLRRLSDLCDDESLRNRSWALVQAMNRGASIESLMSGFELANRYQPDHDFVNKEFDDHDASAASSIR